MPDQQRKMVVLNDKEFHIVKKNITDLRAEVAPEPSVIILSNLPQKDSTSLVDTIIEMYLEDLKEDLKYDADISPMAIVLSDEDYEDASVFLSKIKKRSKEIDVALKPFLKARKAKSDLQRPLKEIESKVKQMMVEYKEMEREAAEEAVKGMKELLTKAAEKRRDDKVYELAGMGMEEEAQELLDRPVKVSEILPNVNLVQNTKVEGSYTTTKITWDLIDLEGVREEFLLPKSLDTVKVRRVVKEKGMDAAKIVGGIECRETIGIVGKAEK